MRAKLESGASFSFVWLTILIKCGLFLQNIKFILSQFYKLSTLMELSLCVKFMNAIFIASSVANNLKTV